MIQSQKLVNTTSLTHWKIGNDPMVLKCIDQKDINIAICERDISGMTNEIQDLLKQNIEIRSSGDIDTILNEISEVLKPNSLIKKDIEELLYHFAEIVQGSTFRLLLATINTNMCRKFHTDINDVRLLCTYSGPGTLWLTDDNINQKALELTGDDEYIIIEEDNIQQAKTGAVVLLKGALYPHEETMAIVHRSPTIEESGEKRLFLRIDSNTTINFWT